MRSTFKWLSKSIAHNCLVHPLLPLAKVMEISGYRSIPKFVYWLHDKTAPLE